MHQETIESTKNEPPPVPFLDFSPLKRYNLPARTRSSMGPSSSDSPGLSVRSELTLDFELCVGGAHPLSGGRACPEHSRRIHPLYRVDRNLSITYIISILSILIAPNLHQKSALRVDRMAASLPTEDRGCSATTGEASPPDRLSCQKPGRERSEHPALSAAKIRSLHPGREQSEHLINWIGVSTVRNCMLYN